MGLRHQTEVCEVQVLRTVGHQSCQGGAQAEGEHEHRGERSRNQEAHRMTPEPVSDEQYVLLFSQGIRSEDFPHSSRRPSFVDAVGFEPTTSAL